MWANHRWQNIIRHEGFYLPKIIENLFVPKVTSLKTSKFFALKVVFYKTFHKLVRKTFEGFEKSLKIIACIQCLLAKDICYTYLWYLISLYSIFQLQALPSAMVWSSPVNLEVSDMTKNQEKFSSAGSCTEGSFVGSDDISLELEITSFLEMMLNKQLCAWFWSKSTS